MNTKKALTILKNNGYKSTKRREDILMYFEQEDGYRTAKDLLEHLQDQYQGISFDTIYRNLHLYHEIGILETTELNSEKHFRMNCSENHHHHFICNECGNTKDIEVCPMDAIKNKLHNYEIEDHKFEIYGLCPTCQSA